jgi:hypothetical protein
MEKAYFDDAIQSVKFVYNDTAGGVDIEIPHFWEYVGMTPPLLSSPSLLPLSNPLPLNLFVCRTRSKLPSVVRSH